MKKGNSKGETRQSQTSKEGTSSVAGIGPTRFRDELLRFFFAPSTAHTLAPIRVFTGLMIVYIHAVWLMRLDSFFGPNAIVHSDVWKMLHDGERGDAKWTYLAYSDSLWVASVHEWSALFAGLFAAAGVASRFSMFVAWLLTLLTAHRLTGFLFGLDQVVLMLSSYLWLSGSGSVLSVDCWLAQKRPGLARSAWFQWITGTAFHTNQTPSRHLAQGTAMWNNTLSTRLMQLHLCIIYLFGGLGKLRGEMWWDGTAMWYSAAAYEYQSMDLTWIGSYPLLGAMLTHATVFWEVGYCAMIWPRWTRPWTMVMAVLVHGGIAIYLGMVTFGWMMIVANMAFVTPSLMRRIYPAVLH